VIDRLLPPGVVAVEARGDLTVELFAEEEALVRRAVPKRRGEFATARGCARAALAELGFPASAIQSGERGEPLWPAGAVGSITHCEGYRACAVARGEQALAIGIDAEPNAPLRDGLIADIARPEELPDLRRLRADRPDVCWPRLLFSAKESVYKCWYPLARRWLGFEDAVVALDELERTFTVRLLVEPPVATRRSLARMSGRWLVADGLILTAIVLPAPERPGASV
jgi:4'-phosphopantetheinyl transferase EntD